MELMNLETAHLNRCIQTLDRSLSQLRQAPEGSVEYEVFRNAVVKGFELSLETAGKLLRKALKSYASNPRTVEQLTFKDVLRQAARHGLIDGDSAERWFGYRDNRNNTALDYGAGFAEDTLKLLPEFIIDARAVESVSREKFGHAQS